MTVPADFAPAAARAAARFDAALAELRAAAVPGHVCDAACVDLAGTECGCSAAPTECDECAAFFAVHPGIL